MDHKVYKWGPLDKSFIYRGHKVIIKQRLMMFETYINALALPMWSLSSTEARVKGIAFLNRALDS